MAIDAKLQAKLKEIRLKEEATDFKSRAIIKLLLEEKIEITESVEAVFTDLLYDCDVRVCGVCNALMKEGYCIEGGFDYRCSDECLFTDTTEDEWDELTKDGEGDSYWTEWECRREMYKHINMIVAKHPELKYKVDIGYFPELKDWRMFQCNK